MQALKDKVDIAVQQVEETKDSVSDKFEEFKSKFDEMQQHVFGKLGGRRGEPKPKKKNF